MQKNNSTKQRMDPLHWILWYAGILAGTWFGSVPGVGPRVITIIVAAIVVSRWLAGRAIDAWTRPR